MKFGKLEDLSRVDFRMPADHPQNAILLRPHAKKASETPFRAYIGAPGWSNPEWLGRWYPPQAKPGDFLRHYVQQFGTIELNATHYRIPDPETTLRWRALAPAGFKFCPKVPQQISHYSKLKAEIPTTAFISAIANLEEKLGPTFIQLPDYQTPEIADQVLQFAREWPRELPLQWEFRHASWFQGHPQAEDVFETLTELGQGLVLTDVAGRRDVLHMRLVHPVLVLRFVGNALHPSDYARTDVWIERLQAWADMGLREAYIFIHQPEMDEVPEFSNYWAERLRTAMKLDVVAPRLWQANPPAQQSLF